MTAHLLKSLFMASRPSLLRFLRVRGASEEESEDLIQDLFLKLDGQPMGSIENPRAYLYRMADNLMLDRKRASLRRLKREEHWAGARTFFGATPIDGSVAADEVLISQEQLHLVCEALATLPERTVEIFRRFRVEGDRQRQIAADLGISVSAVEKHLQRAYEVVLSVRSRIDAGKSPPHRLKGESEFDVI